MNNQHDKKSAHPKKKWLALALVGTALLLIPRRSSRQDSPTWADPLIDGATDEAKPIDIPNKKE